MKKLFKQLLLIILILSFSLSAVGCNGGIGGDSEHTLTYHGAVSPTCQKEGVKEHYSCAHCNKNFIDIGATEEIKNLTLEKLPHAFIKGQCERCYVLEGYTSTYTIVDKNGNEDLFGSYILFGRYPQADVTSDLGGELNEYVTALPNDVENNGFTNYGYKESSMWFKDVYHTDGEIYRAVYIEKYRPYGRDANDSYQDDNGYYEDYLYWFKFEPVKWRILYEDNGEALILSELILDSQAYQASWVYSANPNNSWTGFYASDSLGNIIIDSYNEKVDANNYEYSSIRKFLNENFYNTAFNSFQKELIKLTLVENGPETHASAANGFFSKDTNDNIFLPCYQDMIKPSYGFDDKDDENDLIRRKVGSDYSKIQGLSVSGECGNWWTRSPKTGFGYYTQLVSASGTVYGGDYVYLSSYGVVPALYIRLS